MTRDARIRLLLAVVALGVAAAAGCTSSDPLTPGNGSVVIIVEATPYGLRFESAGFQLDQIYVRPVNQQAAESLANSPIALLPGRIEDRVQVDFVNDFDGNRAAVLPAGTYRVTGIALRTIYLVDQDSTAGAATCHDSQTAFTSSAPLAITFPSPTTISVDGSGTTLTITIDADAFLQAFIDNHFFGGTPPGCFLAFFNEFLFSGQASQTISVE